jgi:Tol biopolymer transport system component
LPDRSADALILEAMTVRRPIVLATLTLVLVGSGWPTILHALASDRPVIAFTSHRSGNMDVWLMEADGSNPRRLTSTGAGDRHPTWAPDGRHLGFMSMRANGNPDIYRMRIDGSHVRRLTFAAGEDCCPEWSPNGRRIVFESHRRGNFDIFVMRSDGSKQIDLTPNGVYDGTPTWSANGHRIAFRSTRAGSNDIYVMHPNGSHVHRIPGRGLNRTPAGRR